MLSRLQPYVPGSSPDAQDGVHLLQLYYSYSYTCSCFPHAFPATLCGTGRSPEHPARSPAAAQAVALLSCLFLLPMATPTMATHHGYTY